MSNPTTGATGTDDGEIIPDVDTPWLPVLADPAVALPSAAVAAGTGALTWWANSEAGLVLPVLYGLIAAALVILSVIDMKVLRLPNPLVLPLYPVTLAAILAAAVLGETGWPDVLTALCCMAGCWLVLFAAAVFLGGLGYGDVKLAGLLGLVLGVQGPFAAALGTLMLPMAGGGLIALALVMCGRRGAIPFGPFIAGGALLVLLLPDVVIPLFLGRL